MAILKLAVSLIPDGSVTNTLEGEGDTSCTKCQIGSSSAKSIEACSACEAGTFASAEGFNVCLDCKKVLSKSKGQAECLPANKGYYVETTKAIMPEDCRPGTYTEYEASPSKESCKALPGYRPDGNFNKVSLPDGSRDISKEIDDETDSERASREQKCWQLAGYNEVERFLDVEDLYCCEIEAGYQGKVIGSTTDPYYYVEGGLDIAILKM